MTVFKLFFRKLVYIQLLYYTKTIMYLVLHSTLLLVKLEVVVLTRLLLTVLVLNVVPLISQLISQFQLEKQEPEVYQLLSKDLQRQKSILKIEKMVLVVSLMLLRNQVRIINHFTINLLSIVNFDALTSCYLY